MVKNPPAIAGNTGDAGSIPVSERSLGGGNGNPLQPVFLPGQTPGQRSLASYSPWGHKESDTAQGLSMHTHQIPALCDCCLLLCLILDTLFKWTFFIILCVFCS